MARARLHIICGNCGCNDMFDWRYETKNSDNGDGTFSPDVYINCNNCGTLHVLGDNASQQMIDAQEGE